MGSASMARGLSPGGVPAKVMVPLMVAAAATPGQPSTVTRPAGSHNRFRVPRVIRSLVIGPPVSFVVANDALYRKGQSMEGFSPWREFYDRLVTFSKDPSLLSDLHVRQGFGGQVRRSRTRVIRPASGPR